MNPNPYRNLDDAELSLILIALAGYTDNPLCEEFGQVESILIARHYGHYPAWYTDASIAVYHLIRRYPPPDPPERRIMIPMTAAAIEKAGDTVPQTFFDENTPLVDILRQLAESGLSLHWNAPLRALEIIPQNALPTPAYATSVNS